MSTFARRPERAQGAARDARRAQDRAPAIWAPAAPTRPPRAAGRAARAPPCPPLTRLRSLATSTGPLLLSSHSRPITQVKYNREGKRTRCVGRPPALPRGRPRRSAEVLAARGAQRRREGSLEGEGGVFGQGSECAVWAPRCCPTSAPPRS